MTRILLGEQLMQGDAGAIVTIMDAELHYLKNVRRHVAGDSVIVVDGRGNSFNAEVISIGRDQAVLKLTDALSESIHSWPVHILAAVPKENILDDVIRKISELGVDRFTPIICDRSSVVPGVQRMERWRRIASQAMRQCRRSTVLEIAEPLKFKDAIKSTDAEYKYILHPCGDTAAGALFSGRKSGSVAILVGPEGGFSGNEMAQSAEHSFRPIQLGTTILRMETAMLVASVMCIAFLGGYDE